MVSASILVLTKNGSKDIGALLQAVYSQEEVRANEVVLIDSGSSDATLQIARQYPVRIEHIQPDSFHHARTRNLAAELTSSEILVFLSQDAVPASPTWLAAMLANFKDAGVGAVYGRQFPKSQSSLERQNVLETIYGEQRLVKDPALGNRLGYRFYHFSDANSAIRRSVWQGTRFPEELAVFEDLGIAKRILDAGWKIVYEPRACVFHSHQHSTFELFKRYFDIGFTLKQLKIWNAPGVGGSMLRDAGNLLKRKLVPSASRSSRAALNGMCQDLAKSAGLFLGLNERYLPLGVKKHLSAHQVFRGNCAVG
jgi:rhamnosyltransferase